MSTPSLAVPFGETADFVLASAKPPALYNFYRSLEDAAADADRANCKACRTCSAPVTGSLTERARCEKCGTFLFLREYAYVPYDLGGL